MAEKTPTAASPHADRANQQTSTAGSLFIGRDGPRRDRKAPLSRVPADIDRVMNYLRSQEQADEIRE